MRRSQEYALAAALYSEAIALSPPPATEAAAFHGNRAACYYHLARYADCVADCTAALGVDPGYAKVWERI